jgi:hypothetical protein
VPGTDLPAQLPASTQRQALAHRCSRTPGCAGFYTTGALKLDLNATAPAPALALPKGALAPPACHGTYVAQGDPYAPWLGLRADLSAAAAAQNATAQAYRAFARALDAAQALKASAAAGAGARAMGAPAAGSASSSIVVSRMPLTPLLVASHVPRPGPVQVQVQVQARLLD